MKRSLFETIPAELPEELLTVLVKKDRVKVERIVSDGHASPEGFWYDQNQDEWVLLVSGTATLSIEQDSGVEQIEMKAGDYLLIPAHQRHRVEATSATEKTIWLAVFL
jgi:cupin 2 domain-containing protein